MNNVSLTGRPIFDIRVNRTYGGKQVVNFVLGVQRTGHNEESVEYIDCIAWDELAKKIEHCRKGTLLEITGHIVNEKYEDKTGTKRKAQKVLAHRIEFLERTVSTVIDGVYEELQKDYGYDERD